MSSSNLVRWSGLATMLGAVECGLYRLLASLLWVLPPRWRVLPLVLGLAALLPVWSLGLDAAGLRSLVRRRAGYGEKKKASAAMT